MYNQKRIKSNHDLFELDYLPVWKYSDINKEFRLIFQSDFERKKIFLQIYNRNGYLSAVKKDVENILKYLRKNISESECIEVEKILLTCV